MKKPIDCYQLLSCNLFSFVILWLTNPKMTYGAFFPLSFCPWTQIFMQNSETTTNTVFWNPPSLRLHKSVVNLKIQYLFSSLHSACKFVFRDKKWVEKMSHKSYFGLVSQNVTNQKRLHDKSWYQSMGFFTLKVSYDIHILILFFVF